MDEIKLTTSIADYNNASMAWATTASSINLFSSYSNNEKNVDELLKPIQEMKKIYQEENRGFFNEKEYLVVMNNDNYNKLAARTGIILKKDSDGQITTTSTLYGIKIRIDNSIEGIHLIKKGEKGDMEFTYSCYPSISFGFSTKLGTEKLPKKYIINCGAAVLFWSDGDKTISKRDAADKFDKRMGFLLAYYYKKCGVSKAARKRILDCVKEEKMFRFLLEFFVKETDMDYEKANKYLENLKISD